MNKKSHYKKLPRAVKIILIIIVVFAAIRICLEIPALPYDIRPAAKLDNNKILYIKDYEDPKQQNFSRDAVHIKTYVDNKAKEELVYEFKEEESLLGSYIIGNKVVLAVGLSKPTPHATHDTFIYTYENSQLTKINEMINDKMQKVIKIDNDTIGIFYFDKFKIIDINGNVENNKEISLNIIDQSDRDYSTSGFSEEKMISVKEGNLYLHTFTYNKNNNTITIEGRFKGYETKVIVCSLLQDNSCKVEEEPPNKNIITADKPNISIESNTIYRSAHGYYDFFRTWYIVHSIVKEDDAGNKVVLDKVVSTNFLDLLGESRSYMYEKISANKDYFIYSSNFNTYVLEIATGRKKLIEKNAIPLYME